MPEEGQRGEEGDEEEEWEPEELRVLDRLLARMVNEGKLYEGLEPPITREEIEQRKRNKGKTYTTAEVLAHLKRLEEQQ